VTGTPGCPWTAVSDAGWLEITAGASGTGSGTVAFSVAPSARGNTRTGTITVAGRAFTVRQHGVPCTFAVAPRFLRARAAGGQIAVSVATPKGCAWTAASQVPWLTATGGVPGTGPGTAVFRAAPRTGLAPRFGTVTVAGRPVLVLQ
jgi:hypothetical protein